MSEMIERVARAVIADWQAAKPTVCACVGPAEGEPACRCKMEQARETARVAIAAMRKPTQTMLDTGVAAYRVEGGLLSVDNLLAAWTAGIDAALKD